MTDNLTHIHNTKEYENALVLLNRIFCVDSELPNQVFRLPFSGFILQDFDFTMSKNFWDEFLKPLANFYKEEYILTAVLDPDPIDYFHHNFGYYNMVKFPVDITGSSYWKSLESGPKNSPADAILYNSEVVVWAPSSAKWAIWGQRGWEVCILAFADQDTQNIVNSILSQDWDTAYNALSSFTLQHLPQDSLKLFLKNYSITKKV